MYLPLDSAVKRLNISEADIFTFYFCNTKTWKIHIYHLIFPILILYIKS